jgi:hypothetical protein
MPSSSKPARKKGEEDILQEAAVEFVIKKYPPLKEHIRVDGSRLLKSSVPFCFSLAGLDITAATTKAQDMGYWNGRPDFEFNVARGGYFGLFIEFKIRPNKPTETQMETLKMLKNNGYLVQVVWDIDQFINLFKWYMSLPATVPISRIVNNIPEFALFDPNQPFKKKEPKRSRSALGTIKSSELNAQKRLRFTTNERPLKKNKKEKEPPSPSKIRKSAVKDSPRKPKSPKRIILELLKKHQ